MIFSDKHQFLLRPIFFAYEDRAQIIHLIVETYNRLAATINTDEDLISAKMIWEKTTVVMTDSVSKNLKIGKGVAETLQSFYVSYHHLCKSHPVDSFVQSNLSVLTSVENEIKFWEKIQTMNPAVKSFLRGNTSVDEAAITSILSLVSHNKSSHSTNQANLFGYIVQREGQIKHIA